MTISRLTSFIAAILVAAPGCDQDQDWNLPDALGDTTGDTAGDSDAGWDSTGTDTTGTDTSVTDTGGDTGVDDPGVDDPGSGCVPTIATTSNFTTIDGFMDYINTQRRNYGGEGGYGRHDRWKGIPWVGEYHTNTTFPNAFAWDDGLAARAQEEACRLASGGAVAGERVNGASPGLKPFWIDGINTADWMISVKEDAGDWEPSAWGGDMPFGLHHSNGSSRLGLHYHDFGGDGPAINNVGAGARDDGAGSTWWVLQFGP